MTLKLFQEVALSGDIPEQHLKTGDVATLLDYVPHTRSGEDSCFLEGFNAIGEAISVVIVPISAIEALRADEILEVRSLAEAS